ncbi:DUF502 domain-containing protein [candidate division WOR-3 bacterium]|nr:DUF502 domain-containing protein [candidate division WOR-3 bacterium]
MEDKDDLPHPGLGFKSKIRNIFVTGIVTVLPLGLTLIAFKFIIELGGNVLKPFADYLNLPEIVEDIIGFSILVGFVFLIGAVARTFLGKMLINWTHSVMTKLPLVKIVYNGVKELTETFFLDKRAFQKVVMIEYPRTGCWSLGFLTNTESWVEKTCAEGNGTKLSSVFIPTTPNPTSGFYLLLPEKEIKMTDLTIEEGLRIIVSGGIITPKKIVKIREG